MHIFTKKAPPEDEEKRCGGCCCTCPASAPKCNKGRAAFGLPLISEENNDEKDG